MYKQCTYIAHLLPHESVTSNKYCIMMYAMWWYEYDMEVKSGLILEIMYLIKLKA